MTYKRKEFTLRWNEPDTAIAKRLKKGVFSKIRGDVGVEQAWRAYLSAGIKFPFLAYIKAPSFPPIPNQTTYRSINLVELADPMYALGGNVVFLGSIMRSENDCFLFFLHDFAAVHADKDTVAAIQDYLYWHHFLKRQIPPP